MRKSKEQECFARCAQTRPDATRPIGKNHSFSKIAVIFFTTAVILMSFEIENFRGGKGSQSHLINEIRSTVFVEQPLTLPRPANDKDILPNKFVWEPSQLATMQNICIESVADGCHISS